MSSPATTNRAGGRAGQGGDGGGEVEVGPAPAAAPLGEVGGGIRPAQAEVVDGRRRARAAAEAGGRGHTGRVEPALRIGGRARACPVEFTVSAFLRNDRCCGGTPVRLFGLGEEPADLV